MRITVVVGAKSVVHGIPFGPVPLLNVSVTVLPVACRVTGSFGHEELHHTTTAS